MRERASRRRAVEGKIAYAVGGHDEPSVARPDFDGIGEVRVAHEAELLLLRKMVSKRAGQQQTCDIEGKNTGRDPFR